MGHLDLNLIARIPDWDLMDIRRAHRIIDDYTIAFFNRYLNNDLPSLVDGMAPSPYEEVTVASRIFDRQNGWFRSDES